MQERESVRALKKVFLLFLFMTQVGLVSGFKIDRVIVSSDANPFFLDFWPIVAKAWNKMGIKPTLALIATEDVQVDETIGDVIRFEPLAGVPRVCQAKYIRLLLPAYFEDEVCLISDIDMLPLNKDYFIENVKDVPDDCFAVYRDKAYGGRYSVYKRNRYPMCYTAAKGSVFKEIFQIRSTEDIPRIMRRWTKKWGRHKSDEYPLTILVMTWKYFHTRCVRLGLGVKRIDRSNWIYDVDKLKDGYYIDSHMLRPYSKYKKEIDELLFHLGITL